MNKYLNFLTNKRLRFSVLARKGFYKNMSDENFLKEKYKLSYGKDLDLKNPQTYNEKLQWLKINDRNPIYTTMVDKCEAKKYVADIIGKEYTIPTLGVWDKFEDIDFDSLPNQFVLKCTHDSGGLVVCRNKKELNLKFAKKKIKKTLKLNYFWAGREWPYKNVKPRIIAEQFISAHGQYNAPTSVESSVSCDELQAKHGLLDYKFMCFDGKVKALFLDIGVIGTGTGHAEEYYRNVYDRDGNLLPVKETRDNYPEKVVLPDNLAKMVEVAEKLSTGIPHLRVDLYNFGGNSIKVGEMTFYHGSGISNVFMPEEWNTTFGSWIDCKKAFCSK